MFKKRMVVTAVILMTLLSMSVLVSAQDKKVEAIKNKAFNYLKNIYPALQFQLVSFKKDEKLPFYAGSVKFNSRGRQAEGHFYVTLDGKYLIIGDIWDLNVDPNKARWQQMAEGAADRMKKINLANRPYKGNPNAKVVVVEYSDYQCPFCKRAFEQLERKLLEQYGDKIKFVYKHFPLTQIHPWAMKAAIGMACVDKVAGNKAYWKVYEKIFTNQQQINKDNIRDKFGEFLDAAGLSKEKKQILACLDKEETRDIVQKDLQEGQSIGVNSTPTFVINGVLLPGARQFQEMASYIDLAFKNATAKGKKK